MTSLPSGYRALIFGASGGIGRAFCEALARDNRCGALYATTRSGDLPVGLEATGLALDLTDKSSIEAAIAAAADSGPLHLVIVATGLLHGDGVQPEKTWRHLDPTAMARVFAINTIGPALIAANALPRLDRSGKAVFAALSARVGSVSDNRLGGWHSYRASKSALNQILKTCAIELSRRAPDALCIGLHPGTVDTGLSQPFQGNVPDGRLFTPEQSAASLLDVINGLDGAHTGRVFDWAGDEVLP